MMDALFRSKIWDQLSGLLTKKVFWQAAILLGAAFCIYFRTIHGLFLWDDDDYVTKNLALRSLAGLKDIWLNPGSLSQYYPLTYTSFWIDYHLWGLNSFGYHFANMVLHAINTLLVWRVLEHFKLRYAWLAALLFALHPVHVESVAWITERKNLLSGCFFLLSLWAYLKTRYFLSYAFFLGALGSKTITATLPAVLLILLWWQNGKVAKADWLRFALFVLTVLLIIPVSIFLESQHVLRMGTPDWNFSLADRVLIAGRAVWFYFFKVLWPHPLIFFYPRWAIDPREVWQWFYPAAFASAAAALWVLRKRVGRGPFAALAIYAVMLFPALGFKNYFPMRYSFVADHFQYLASIAAIVPLAALFSVLLKDDRIRKVTAFLVLLVLAVLTWNRQAAFASLEALWRDTIRKNPSAWMPYNNYGALLMDRGDYEIAKQYFNEAVRLAPEEAESFNNLGLLFQKKGDAGNAIPYFLKAVQMRPRFSLFHLNLGTAYFDLGNIDRAALEYRRALELNPKFGEVYFSLGNISLQKENFGEAEEMLRQAIRFSPDFADAYTTLAFICSKLGKRDEAIRHYLMALKLDPRQAFAHNNLANALSAQGLFKEANEHYRAAMALEPASFQFRVNFADSLQREGRAEESERYYQEAIRLQSAGAQKKTGYRILTQPTPQADTV